MIKPQHKSINSRTELLAKSMKGLNNRQKLEILLDYGLLAPSTHNTQPWLVKYVGEDQLAVKADLKKRIPVADSTNRDMMISLGAFYRNIQLASEAFGISCDIKITDNKADLPSALLEFKSLSKGAYPNNPKLLEAIIRRQNFRGFFEKGIPNQNIRRTLKSVSSLDVQIDIIDESDEIKRLARLTSDSLKDAYKRLEFRKEISEYINHNLSRKMTGLHGYSLRLNLFQSWLMPKVLKRKDIGPKLAKLNYDSFITADSVIIISAKDNPVSWVKTGLVLEECLVKLTLSGYHSSIYVAAIENSENRAKVFQNIDVKKNYKPQILFCVGRTDTLLPYSVRQNLDSLMER